MARQEIHYEICTEDGQGFDPLGCSCATRAEAEQALRKYLPSYPGAFVVRTTMTRVERQIYPMTLKAV